MLNSLSELRSAALRFSLGLAAIGTMVLSVSTASAVSPKACAAATSSLQPCLDCCVLIIWDVPGDYNRCVLTCYERHEAGGPT